MEKSRRFCRPVLGWQCCISIETIQWVSVITQGLEICYWKDHQLKMKLKKIKQIQLHHLRTGNNSNCPVEVLFGLVGQQVFASPNIHEIIAWSGYLMSIDILKNVFFYEALILLRNNLSGIIPISQNGIFDPLLLTIL